MLRVPAHELAATEQYLAVLEGHPHSAQGGTIEVYEFLPIPGM